MLLQDEAVRRPGLWPPTSQPEILRQETVLLTLQATNVSGTSQPGGSRFLSTHGRGLRSNIFRTDFSKWTLINFKSPKIGSNSAKRRDPCQVPMAPRSLYCNVCPAVSARLYRIKSPWSYSKLYGYLQIPATAERASYDQVFATSLCLKTIGGKFEVPLWSGSSRAEDLCTYLAGDLWLSIVRLDPQCPE